MKRLLVVGFGDIALRAVAHLAGRIRIYALVRSADRREALLARGILPLRGDLDQADSLKRLAGLAHHILYFAPPKNRGSQDLRIRNLLAALGTSSSLPQHLVYISTSGVYGDCRGGLAPETRPARPATHRAQRRLDAETRLRAWGRRSGVNVSILRVPGIYASGRLPLERIREGLPALRREEDSYTNHIHADDLARIAVAALRFGRPGRVYNASDDAAMKMGDYFDRVADCFGLPRPPRVSRVEAQQRLPPGLLSFLGESRRLPNARMKRELRVRLRHPQVSMESLKG